MGCLIESEYMSKSEWIGPRDFTQSYHLIRGHPNSDVFVFGFGCSPYDLGCSIIYLEKKDSENIALTWVVKSKVPLCVIA